MLKIAFCCCWQIKTCDNWFLIYLSMTFSTCNFIYSDNQKTTKYEDDIISVLKCIWSRYKANSFTRHFKNYFFCEMGLFTLHKYCVSWLMIYFKLNLILKIFLLILSFMVISECSLTLFLRGGSIRPPPTCSFFT